MLGLDGKVNTCEPTINLVEPEESKMLTDSSQKATWSVLVFTNSKTGIIRPSGDRWHLTSMSVLLYAVVVPSAFISQGLAGAIYIFVALIWLVPDRHIEREIENDPTH